MIKIEAEISELEEQMNHPEFYLTDESSEILELYNLLKKDLAEAEKVWEQAVADWDERIQ